MAPALLSQPTQAAPPIRVVLADDSAAIRTLARHALSAQRGFDVIEAVDGVAAVEAVEAVRPDCVVLDIQMPRMDGFEALAEMRERAPEVPVILLSGQSDDEVAVRARELGASSYVNKITSLGSLADAVREATAAGTVGAPPEVSASPFSQASTDAPADRAAVAEVADNAALAAEMRRLEYVVSHDLGEPLRIMSGFAGLLDTRYADALDDSGRTFLGHIVDAAGRMQRMLDDLLAYSRAGRVEPSIESADLGAVAERVLGALREQIEERAAEIAVAHLPVARCDPGLFQTVLRHVVANAILFNRSTPPRVAIDGRVDGDQVVVTVTDNGIGVPSADRERVFELFARLNAREAYPGTGTGLTLCRRLMGAQGGSISLDSASEGGTTVTLRLPTTAEVPPSRSGSHDGTH